MHELLIERSAERDLDRLSKVVRERIIPKIKGLAEAPRPAGTRKITGTRRDWRLRVGDHRIIYEVNDQERVVKVWRVRHRREAYR